MDNTKIWFAPCECGKERAFFATQGELDDAEGVIECERCGRMNKPGRETVKTLIYCESGYYGSHFKFNNASYAFRNRYNNGNFAKFFHMNANKVEIANRLGLPMEAMPEYDYEFIDCDSWRK